VVELLCVFRHVGFLFQVGLATEGRSLRPVNLGRRELMNVNWKRILDIFVATLLVAGGLNWGLIGLFRVDLVAAICGGLPFGETSVLSRLIYSLIGLAAGYSVYQVVSLKGLEQHWRFRRRKDAPAVTAEHGAGAASKTEA
jgi:hypothetical protein